MTHIPLGKASSKQASKQAAAVTSPGCYQGQAAAVFHWAVDSSRGNFPDSALEKQAAAVTLPGCYHSQAAAVFHWAACLSCGDLAGLSPLIYLWGALGGRWRHTVPNRERDLPTGLSTTRPSTQSQGRACGRTVQTGVTLVPYATAAFKAGPLTTFKIHNINSFRSSYQPAVWSTRSG